MTRSAWYGTSRPKADVVELHEDVDGDERGHQREEDVEIGDVVLVVPDGAAPENHPEALDPLQDEQGKDAQKDPEQEKSPEDEGGVEVLEPGQEMEIGEGQGEGVADSQDHRREDREIDPGGDPVREVLPPLEIEAQQEGRQGQDPGRNRGEAEEFPAHRRQQGAADGPVDEVVHQEFFPLPLGLADRVEEKDEREDEGQMERPVPPLLQHPESRRVDVEDGQDQGHRVHQLQGDARKPAETEFGIVLGDLVDIFDHMSRRGDLFLCRRWSVVHLISSSCD